MIRRTAARSVLRLRRLRRSARAGIEVTASCAKDGTALMMRAMATRVKLTPRETIAHLPWNVSRPYRQPLIPPLVVGHRRRNRRQTAETQRTLPSTPPAPATQFSCRLRHGPPRFLSHFRGALFSSQRATARIGLLRPSLAHGVEPVARSGPFHGDPAPMAPRVSRCVGWSREFLGGSREWSTPSWCILMHHARAKPQSAGSF